MSNQIISQKGYQKLQKELDDLIKNRQGITARIKSAKELGDLSENAEYHEAKDAQGFSEGRIAEIKQILKDVEVVNESANGKINMGSRVLVEVNEEEKELEIVSFNEVDPLVGKISNESPLGIAILNKKKGDIVVINTPRGEMEYKILDVK